DELGEIVECYVAPCAMTIGNQQVPQGAWLLGVIWSPQQFALIKSGQRTGLSMGGTARRRPLAGGRISLPVGRDLVDPLTRSSATAKFNPYHDERGRFTEADNAQTRTATDRATEVTPANLPKWFDRLIAVSNKGRDDSTQEAWARFYAYEKDPTD